MRFAPSRRFIASIMASSLLMSSCAFATQEKIETTTFSGSFLAGHVAELNGDLDAATRYYKQALAWQKDSIPIKHDLVLALLAMGDFKGATTYAQNLSNPNETNRFIPFTLAVQAFKKKKYQNIAQILSFKKPSDLDKLTSALLNAWASFGLKKYAAAKQHLQEQMGPAWFDIFKNYHMALMSDLAKDTVAAEKYYNQALNDQQGGATAPDTYERILISYASFQVRNNHRDAAIQILRTGEGALKGRDTLKILREKIERGYTPPLTARTVSEGASEVLYNVGAAINRSGADVYARICLYLSLALFDKNDATLFQLAEVAAGQKEHEKAIALYRQVPSQSLYAKEAEFRLNMSLADAGKDKEALASLAALEKKHPKEPRIFLLHANIYMKNKNYHDAINILERALSAADSNKRENWTLYYQYGMALERIKQWDKAEVSLRKALELYPNQPDVLNYLGYSLVERNKKLQEALNMVAKAAKMRPDDGYIIDSLGWAYYKLGRYSEAVKMLELAVKLRPNDASINDHLGDAYWQIDRKLDAGFQWNHAISAKPEAEEQEKIEKKIKFGLKDKKIVPNIDIH